MANPQENNPDIPALLLHIYADVHDIAARLARLEAVVDEFAPAARAFAGLGGWRKRGREAGAAADGNGRP